MTEIKEMGPKRFPSFKEFFNDTATTEIYTMAEVTYRLQIEQCGGVIDE